MNDILDISMSTAGNGHYEPYVLASSALKNPLPIAQHFYLASIFSVLDFEDALPLQDLKNRYTKFNKQILFVRDDCFNQADKDIKNAPSNLEDFSIEAKAYFKSLKESELIRALGSSRMEGMRLEWAREVLEEAGIVFNDRQIRSLKNKIIQEKKDKIRGEQMDSWAAVLLYALIFIVLLALLF